MPSTKIEILIDVPIKTIRNNKGIKIEESVLGKWIDKYTVYNIFKLVIYTPRKLQINYVSFTENI